MTPLQQSSWNKSIRDSVDALLHKGGYNEESSARHQLSMMNFDVAVEKAMEPTWQAEQKAHKETNRAMTEALMQAENASCWNDNTTVEIKVLAQGDAVCGTKGYMLKRSTSVAAFYLDGWGATGRIYPEFTSSSVWDGTSTINYPSITISDGSDDGSLSEIYFPEYKGWRVHSVSGGKTAAICLVKEN